jgi:hypothetical protein
VSTGNPSRSWFGKVKRPLFNIIINVGLDTAVILERLDTMASVQQDQIDALTAQVTQFQGDVTTSFAGIQSDLDALKAQIADGQPVDLTAITASVEGLAGVLASAQAIDAETQTP